MCWRSAKQGSNETFQPDVSSEHPLRGWNDATSAGVRASPTYGLHSYFPLDTTTNVKSRTV